METTKITPPKRTASKGIERTEEILRKITDDNFSLQWEYKAKDHRFTLLGYFVLGEIFIVQVFDDGSVYHFLSTSTIRWDLTEDKIKEHFKDFSGFALEKDRPLHAKVAALKQSESTNDIFDKGYNDAIADVLKLLKP